MNNPKEQAFDNVSDDAPTRTVPYSALGRDSYGDVHYASAATQEEADQLLFDTIFRADVDGQPATD